MECPYCGNRDVEKHTGGGYFCQNCQKSIAASHISIANAETGSLNPAGEKPSEEKFLYCESGPLEGQSFAIGADEMRVGRHPTRCQLVLDDPETSREHARLWVEGGQRVFVENLSTTNGTYVNDRRVDQTELKAGDRIRFGVNSPCVFTFRVGNAGPAPAQPPPEKARPGQTDRETSPVEAPPVRQVRTVVFREGEEAPPPNARFQLILDQYAVREFPLTSSRVQLGSAAGPGKIQIEHPTISEVHAELIFSRGGTAVLHDRGSKNGTFVNGERISERVLREGDVVQLGGCDTKLLLYREARRRTVALRATDLKKDVVKLGRAQDNDIKLDHPTVSQHHAEIRRRGDGYELVDRNSTNGTFVNGVRITKHKLQPRDRISIGAVQLFFDGAALEQQSDGNQVRLYAYGLRYAPPNEPSKVLIQNVSLAIEPQEFIGLLGPSGAGKTTLMHALNGSQPAQVGRVMMNGCSLYDEYDALRSTMGYLPQEDILHRSLTVRQCLYYAAKLRLPDDFGEQEIWKRIAEVLLVLDLKERADLPIVMLSGGQRKRVSLGIELLSKPALLFMDEPTAGQDPRTEMHMMRLFREIANRGSTIVCTTHLLGSFSLLDKIAVLVAGRLAYYGPSLEMLAYFRASRPHEVYEKLQSKPAENWESDFQKSQLYRENIANPLGEEKKPAKHKAVAPSRGPAAAGASLFRQLTTLIERQFTLRLSDWKNVAILLGMPTAVAIMVWLLQPVPNEPKVLFLMVFSALWFGCSASVREIVDERQVYARERRQNLGIPAYLGSKLIYLAVVGGVQSFVLTFLVWMVAGGLERHIFTAWSLLWLVTFQGALIGLLISSLANTPEMALYIFPIALIPELLLAGMLIPVEQPAKGFNISASLQGVPVLVELQSKPDGMEPLARFLASAMVSRWTLEPLADLYIHDFDPQKERLDSMENKYSIMLLNSITVTFHEGELGRARQQLENVIPRSVPCETPGCLQAIVPPSQSYLLSRGLGAETAIPKYVLVHLLIMGIMIGATAGFLKLKDRS